MSLGGRVGAVHRWCRAATNPAESKPAKPGRWVQRGIVAFALAGLSACVSYQAPEVAMTPEDLRAAIRAGEVIAPGNRVRVVTAAAGERVLIVREVDATAIRGKPVGATAADAGDAGLAIPIDEVVNIQVAELDVKKTVLASAGTYLLLAVLAALAFVSALSP